MGSYERCRGFATELPSDTEYVGSGELRGVIVGENVVRPEPDTEFERLDEFRSKAPKLTAKTLHSDVELPDRGQLLTTLPRTFGVLLQSPSLGQSLRIG